EVRAVVGRDVDALDRPALAVRQIGGCQAREECAHLRRALLVIEIGDLRLGARRVGGDIALQRNGNIDDAAGHGVLPSELCLSWVALFSEYIATSALPRNCLQKSL